MLFAAAAAALVAIGAGTAHAHDMQHMTMEGQAEPTSASLYNLESTWTNQDGASVPLGALGGKPVVAAMGYTSCKDMCPAIVANMMWIEKNLPQDAAKRVTFALFSINSAVDTPAKLKAYANEHRLDPGRWTLFHGDDDAVREIAAALSVGYRPDWAGRLRSCRGDFAHRREGEILVQQRGTLASPDELLAASFRARNPLRRTNSFADPSIFDRPGRNPVTIFICQSLTRILTRNILRPVTAEKLTQPIEIYRLLPRYGSRRDQDNSSMNAVGNTHGMEIRSVSAGSAARCGGGRVGGMRDCGEACEE